MEQPDFTTARPAIQKTCRCWYSELHIWNYIQLLKIKASWHTFFFTSMSTFFTQWFNSKAWQPNPAHWHIFSGWKFMARKCFHWKQISVWNAYWSHLTLKTMTVLVSIIHSAMMRNGFSTSKTDTSLHPHFSYQCNLDEPNHTSYYKQRETK